MTSIDFRLAGSFASPHFSRQRSARRAGGNVEASVTLFVPEKNVLFVGLTDGKILCWETDRSATASRGKDGPNRVLDEHKGGIHSMIYAPDMCQGVMFSGAADQCIKMWDLSDPRMAVPCVHSLHGHGGTILTLAYGSDMLLSSSTDGFMCLWRDQSPTKLLRFPALSIRQKIAPKAEAATGGSRNPKETWFLSISIREGESPSIFAGDSDGYVHIYKPDSAAGGDGEAAPLFWLAWKRQIHDLGVSRILTLPMESFLFTVAYDQKFKTLDSLSGQVIFEESNQSCVCFNSIAWDSLSQDVLVVDEKGNIGFYNIYTESCVVWKNLTDEAIIQVEFESSTRRLLVLSAHVLRVYDVVRGIKFSELNEHTGPIVSIASRSTPQGGLLYTASMDDTIRLWDADSLECIKSLKEKKHEITAMVYLPLSNVIITGHESSDLKMWSLDCQMDACLRTVQGKSAHMNTISCLACVVTATSVAADDPDGGGDGRSIESETLVAGSYDRQISFWRVTLTSDGTAMAKFDRAFVAHDEPDDEVLAVAYSAAAGSVFTGGNAGVIRKWSFAGSRVLEAEYEGHNDAVSCFAVDGNFLLSGSVDGNVAIWETSQGYLLKTVCMHNVAVQALAVISDTGWMVSCGFDGRVVLWDPQIGRPDVREVVTYEQPEEFRSIAYVDLNRTILVGCESGKIINFPVPAEGGGDGAREQGQDTASAQPPLFASMETPRSEDARDNILEKMRLAKKKDAS